MQGLVVGLCTGIGLVVILLLVVLYAVRVVREYERLVVFRLGRAMGARGPGVVLLIPIVDQPVKVDLREQYQEIPHQTCITKDNVTISVDFLIYSKVIEAVQSVVNVGKFAGALSLRAKTPYNR